MPCLPDPTTFLILLVAVDLEVEQDQGVLEKGSEDEEDAGENPCLRKK